MLNLLLDHALGKPPEQIHQEQVVFILGSREDTKVQDAEVVDTGSSACRRAVRKNKGRSCFGPCLHFAKLNLPIARLYEHGADPVRIGQ